MPIIRCQMCGAPINVERDFEECKCPYCNSENYKSDCINQSIDDMLLWAGRYEKGEGVAQNDKKALQWYEKAAEYNDLVAIDKVASFYRKQKQYDYLLIEGAGGITCPLRLQNGEKYLLKDLIKDLGANIIIVADGGLGTINSTLLTVEYARQHNIKVEGIILNNFNPDSFMHQDNLKQVEYLTGIKVISTVCKNQTDIKSLEEYFK